MRQMWEYTTTLPDGTVSVHRTDVDIRYTIVALASTGEWYVVMHFTMPGVARDLYRSMKARLRPGTVQLVEVKEET